MTTRNTLAELAPTIINVERLEHDSGDFYSVEMFFPRRLNALLPDISPGALLNLLLTDSHEPLSTAIH